MSVVADLVGLTVNVGGWTLKLGEVNQERRTFAVVESDPPGIGEITWREAWKAVGMGVPAPVRSNKETDNA